MYKNKRDVEKEYSRQQFISKLKRLIEALELNKSFRIQVGNEKLFIPANAIVNIEHEREGEQNELEFQIKWKKK